MAAGVARSHGKVKVEVPHNTVHRMIVIRVVSFVEDKKANLPAKIDVSMTESIEENLRGRDYNTVFSENVLPQVGVRPLFRFQTTVDESNGTDGFLDHFVLLLTKRHGWCNEP